ncbi:hypothetical protein Rhe02_53510 [Rhizocola hellebori]|uniref:Uncharacterized protein n=1 Tax=Rhizocola hellebori TaxID=1392758 RepID=A0A8J3VHD2_9ACTN|nr:SCO2522 family protein [Rhizocola hellebori]GIH07284.1 hypothetical protein Rhe02_53510 [Rhizocola hellebori]
MTEPTAAFIEATGESKTRSVPMSHLSVEVGHLYMEDLESGQATVRQRFTGVAPWVEQAVRWCANSSGADRPRISTCYLIDDYFSPDSSPAEIIPMVLAAADDAGLTIDYLARESSCAVESGVAIAELVAAQIVAEPHPSSNGARPAAAASGWLSNGRRSPSGPAVAMKPRRWQPPSESAANRHSIFIDVELWNDQEGGRVYSCPFLAAVWQLARLGLLRANGLPLLQPQQWSAPWPTSWQALPGVIKLNHNASPFSAYSTLSVIAERFLPIEDAVRTVLSQIAVDGAAATQLASQAKGDKLRLAGTVVERIGYVFAPQEPWELTIEDRSVGRRSKAPRSAEPAH